MDDKTIVEMLWRRDVSALDALCENYGHYLFSAAYNILKNRQDAEECVNDTYLGVWNSIPPHKPERLGVFLAKITRNLSLKKWREKTAGKRGGGSAALVLSELDECIGDGKNIDDEIESRELAEIIDSFLRGLPEEERSLFICRYFYFYSVTRLSEKFGFSKSKVKTQLMRSRKKLSIRLEKEGVTL